MGDEIIDQDESYEGTIADEGGYGREESQLYDYDDSAELTDVDEQFDDSKDYTDSGTGVEDFSVTDNKKDDEENNGENSAGQTRANDNFDGGNESFNNSDGDFNGEDDSEPNDDDIDNGDRTDSGQGQEQTDNAGGQSGGKQQDDKSNDKQQEAQAEGKSQKKDYDGYIKWKPGQPITLALLNQVWQECRKIDKLKPMTDAANNAVTQALNTTGSNLTLRLKNYLDKLNDNDTDMIGSLLSMASSDGKRYTYTAFSVAKAFITQEWTEPLLIATLPSAMQAAITAEPTVKSALTAILTVAVPIINLKKRKEGK